MKFLERTLFRGEPDESTASTDPNADMDAGGDLRRELWPAGESGDNGVGVGMFEGVLCECLSQSNVEWVCDRNGLAARQ